MLWESQSVIVMILDQLNYENLLTPLNRFSRAGEHALIGGA
jgi:hypothetical protein